MSNRTRTSIQAACIGIVLAVITACGSATSVNTTPDATQPQTSQPAAGVSESATESAATTQAPATVAHVGDTISVKGIGEEASELAVTLLKVQQTAKSGNEFIVPDKGMRYMSVRFTITNKGPATYSDSPWNGAQVADAEGQRFGTMLADTTAGPSFPGTVNLSVGSKATGWLTFQVPKAATITLVQWGGDSGFGNVAEWQVP